MAKLKLGAIADDKPVKLAVELPADVHRNLAAYADVLARETGAVNPGPGKAGRTSAGALQPNSPICTDYCRSRRGGCLCNDPFDSKRSLALTMPRYLLTILPHSNAAAAGACLARYVLVVSW